MKRFITYIMRENTTDIQVSSNDMSKERGMWLVFLLWLGVGVRVRVHKNGLGLA